MKAPTQKGRESGDALVQLSLVSLEIRRDLLAGHALAPGALEAWKFWMEEAEARVRFHLTAKQAATFERKGRI